MTELIIVLLALNLIVSVATWRKCGQIATPVTAGTMVITTDPLDKGPQNYGRSDIDEYNIQRQRQGLPPEKDEV